MDKEKVTQTSVPEAALEVTCETNILKTTQSDAHIEEPTELQQSQCMPIPNSISEISSKADVLESSTTIAKTELVPAQEQFVTVNQVPVSPKLNKNELSQALSSASAPSQLVQSDVSKSPVVKPIYLSVLFVFDF